MTQWLHDAESKPSAALLAEALMHCYNGEQVQFLVSPGRGGAVVQRLRVALSRSRQRNLRRGVPNNEFTLHHSIYPYALDWKRHDCIVLWIKKHRHHRIREILDDTLRG